MDKGLGRQTQASRQAQKRRPDLTLRERRYNASICLFLSGWMDEWVCCAVL